MKNIALIGSAKIGANLGRLFAFSITQCMIKRRNLYCDKTAAKKADHSCTTMAFIQNPYMSRVGGG